MLHVQHPTVATVGRATSCIHLLLHQLHVSIVILLKHVQLLLLPCKYLLQLFYTLHIKLTMALTIESVITLIMSPWIVEMAFLTNP